MSFLKFGSLTKKAATAVMVAVAGVLMFAGGAGAAIAADEITITDPSSGEYDLTGNDALDDGYLVTDAEVEFELTYTGRGATIAKTDFDFGTNAAGFTLDATTAETGLTFSDGSSTADVQTFKVGLPAGKSAGYYTGKLVITLDASVPLAPVLLEIDLKAVVLSTTATAVIQVSPNADVDLGNETSGFSTSTKSKVISIVNVGGNSAAGLTASFAPGTGSAAGDFVFTPTLASLATALATLGKGEVITTTVSTKDGQSDGDYTGTFTVVATTPASFDVHFDISYDVGVPPTDGVTLGSDATGQTIALTGGIKFTGITCGLTAVTADAGTLAKWDATNSVFGTPAAVALAWNGTKTEVTLTGAGVTFTAAASATNYQLVITGGKTLVVNFAVSADKAFTVNGSSLNPASPTITAGASQTFTVVGLQTLNGGTYTVVFSINDNTKGSINPETGVFRAGSKASGSVTVTATVTAGADNTDPTQTATQTASVTITAAAVPPVVTTTTGATITGAAASDGVIYDVVQGKPRGVIVFIDATKTYVSGTTDIKLDNPKIELTQGSDQSLYFGRVYYTTSETGCLGSNNEVNPNTPPSSNMSWHTGVDKGTDKSAMVSCTYDVYAEVYQHNPGTYVGEKLVGSKKATLVVTPKQITESMITVTITDPEKTYDGKQKSPRVKLVDGVTLTQQFVSTQSGDYTVTVPASGDLSWTNVGNPKVEVKGINNYKGTVDKKTFEIKAAELAFDAYAQYNFKKEYDGTVNVTAAESTLNVIQFTGYPPAVEANKLTAADYKIKAGTYKYSDKNVGKNRTITATIEPNATDLMKNYKFKSTSFSWVGGEIEKGTVTSNNVAKLIASTPKLPDTGLTVKFTGKATSVAAAWASGVTNPAVTGLGDGKITVSYSTTDGKAPVEEGTHTVFVSVNEGANLKATTTPVEFGTIKIDPAGKPTIESITPDTFYYATKSVTLEVKAANPKDGKTTGLSYQWYRQADTGTVTEKGKTAAKFVVNDTAVGPRQYFVKVSYKGSDQDTSSVSSNIIQVDVRPAPVTIKGATVTARSSFDYTGNKVIVTGSDFDVMVGSSGLSEGVDYTIKNIANNTNAGENSAVVTLAGINGYKDEVTGTFTINKKQVTLDDLQIAYGVDYTGETQEIVVRPVTGKSGLGAVTPIYTPADTARLNAGSWTVVLNIADGQNFIGIEGMPIAQQYTIRKVLFDERTMLKYDSLPKDVAWNGKDQGIGAPTLEGLGKKYTGSLRVLYERNGEDLTTAIDSGVYRVKLNIGGDANFSPFEINLGVLTIHHEKWVSVAQSDRVIPGTVKTEEAAVAPVKTVSASVTAGPNPAASNGKVTFFWNGSTQVTGKLIVFTNVGRKVASINVKGAKEIGSWNVNGVAEGTYLVKGVLREKNGGKVGVSTVVGVTK